MPLLSGDWNHPKISSVQRRTCNELCRTREPVVNVGNAAPKTRSNACSVDRYGCPMRSATRATGSPSVTAANALGLGPEDEVDAREAGVVQRDDSPWPGNEGTLGMIVIVVHVHKRRTRLWRWMR